MTQVRAGLEMPNSGWYALRLFNMSTISREWIALQHAHLLPFHDVLIQASDRQASGLARHATQRNATVCRSVEANAIDRVQPHAACVPLASRGGPAFRSGFVFIPVFAVLLSCRASTAPRTPTGTWTSRPACGPPSAKSATPAKWRRCKRVGGITALSECGCCGRFARDF